MANTPKKPAAAGKKANSANGGKKSAPTNKKAVSNEPLSTGRKVLNYLIKPEVSSERRTHMLLLALFCILLFYPPLFQGVFFHPLTATYHLLCASLFLVIWVYKLFWRGDSGFLKSPLDLLMGAFLLAYALSLFVAVQPGEAWYVFLKVLNYFLMFWMARYLVQSREDLAMILKTVAASALCVAVIGLMAASGLSHYDFAWSGGHILSTLQYENATTLYMVLGFAICLGLLLKAGTRLAEFGYSLAGYLMLLTGLATYSKGIWVILPVGLLVMMIGLPGRMRLKALVYAAVIFVSAYVTAHFYLPTFAAEPSTHGLPYLLIGLAGAGLGVAAWYAVDRFYDQAGPRVAWISISTAIVVVAVVAVLYLGGPAALNSRLSAGDYSISALTQTTSFESRRDMYGWALGIMKDHPVFGAGGGGWAALYHTYQSYLDWSTEVHNGYLQVGVETGFLGLAIYLAVWVYLAYMMLRRWRSHRNQTAGDEDEQEAALFWIVAACLAVVAVHSMMDFALSIPAFFALWAVLAGALGWVGKDTELDWYMPACKLANVSIALILGGVLLYCGIAYSVANSYYNAGQARMDTIVSAKGENRSDSLAGVQQSMDDYLKASTLDGSSAEYMSRLAWTESIIFATLAQANSPDADTLYKSVGQHLDAAYALAPWDVKILNSLYSAAGTAGDYKRCLQYAQQMIKANPNDKNAYHQVIATCWSVLDYYLNKMDRVTYVDLARLSLETEKALDAQKKKNMGFDPKLWAGAPLELGTIDYYDLARCEYLVGNYSRCQELLNKIQGSFKTDDVAYMDYNMWQAAARFKLGQPAAENDAKFGSSPYYQMLTK